MTTLEIKVENINASENRIVDVDVAREMTELTKNSLLSQVAASMLTQSSSMSRVALSFLN